MNGNDNHLKDDVEPRINQNDSSKSSARPLDLDDILPEVDEFGRYQKIMLWFVWLPACFPCAFSAMSQLFMVGTPDHWCYTSDLKNMSMENRRKLSIPKVNDSYSKCQRFSVNWTEMLAIDYDGDENYDFNDSMSVIANESWPTEYCTEGWEFNKTEIHSSIVIDFQLVCNKDIFPTLGLVALNLGGPIGVYYFGRLSDRVGRKKAYFICLTTLFLGNILSACADDFWWWAASRVVVGLTIPAVYQIPFIISLELVGPNYRSFVTMMVSLFYIVGLILLCGVTYFVRDWVSLTLATSLPFMTYYLYWFFLPESPRWLLAKGRYDEASKVLENLARVNKKALPPSFQQQLKQRSLLTRTMSEEEALKKTPGFTVLCSTPNMRLKTILITLNWFANETVYVGLSYYGPALGNDEYLSFLLSSVVEIPSSILCWLVIDRWGRRWPLCLSMVVSGISCMTTVLLPEDAVLTTLICFLFAKFSIAASFLIIYPFAGELYPTQVRGVGIGTSAYIGGLGLIIIPFITYLGSENLVLPLFIMGVVSVVGGLTGLRLPETLHHHLPQTIEEGEEFGKDYTMEDCLRCIPLKPEPRSCPYEDLELNPMKEDSEPADEATPLDRPVHRRISLQKLVRQSSVLDTQKAADGTMNMTYWF